MAKQKKKSDEKPLYLGHRQRLKEAFLKDNGASMADYVKLELLLSFAIPRRDVKDKAKELIAKFGSYEKVISASQEELFAEDLTLSTVALVKLVDTTTKTVAGQRLKEKEESVLSSWDEIINYCRVTFGYLNYEEVHAIFLDSSLRVMNFEKIQAGNATSVHVDADDIARIALNRRACKVILAHNHPGGKCVPSKRDIEFTKDVIRVFDGMKIELFDHIIITEDSYYSFKENQLLF